MPFVAVASADRELASKTQVAASHPPRGVNTVDTQALAAKSAPWPLRRSWPVIGSLAQEQPNVQVGEEFCP